MITNADRAARAAAALQAYKGDDNYDCPVDLLTDMLCDLMHHAAEIGEDFDTRVISATASYDHEIEEATSDE